MIGGALLAARATMIATEVQKRQQLQGARLGRVIYDEAQGLTQPLIDAVAANMARGMFKQAGADRREWGNFKDWDEYCIYIDVKMNEMKGALDGILDKK